jgi:hypothetical protein
VQPDKDIAEVSLSTTSHPSASLQMNLTQQGQKSTSGCPEIIIVEQTLSILILSKAYPTSGYNLAHLTRHARLLAGGYFAEKTSKISPHFSTFSSKFNIRQSLTVFASAKQIMTNRG